MGTGAITSHIDVAQLALYGFWIFFFALIAYITRESKREGYPVMREPGEPTGLADWLPPVPEPKRFELPHGRGVAYAPDGRPDDRPIAAEPTARAMGSPLEPTGNPLVDGVGPAAWAMREDVPDLTVEGEPRIVPLRADNSFGLLEGDVDPRGRPVIAADGEKAGEITDVWVDRSEQIIRYLEMRTNAGNTVLIPSNLARFTFVDGEIVQVYSLRSDQFDDCHKTASPTEITRLEEDKIMAYFAGGKFFQTPNSREPLL